MLINTRESNYALKLSAYCFPFLSFRVILKFSKPFTFHISTMQRRLHTSIAFTVMQTFAITYFVFQQFIFLKGVCRLPLHQDMILFSSR